MSIISNTFKCIICMILLMGCSPPEDAPKKEKVDIRTKVSEIQAPEFVLEDLEGRKVRLSDYKGRDILLVFGATWCRYCRAEIPKLEKMYQSYREKGFEILNIYTQESIRKVSSFVDKYDISYKILLDKKGDVARIYGIRGVPTHCLVSRDGLILCYACRDVEVFLSMLFDDQRSG